MMKQKRKGGEKGRVESGTGGKLNGKYHFIFSGTTAVENGRRLLCLTFYLTLYHKKRFFPCCNPI